MLNMHRVIELVEQGYINKAKHPEEDLWIYAYSRSTQYENFWTPETMACRGLILDGDGNVVSRCLPKFFNLGQYTETEKTFMHRPFHLVEKVDGSLGIMYPLKEGVAIASKSSFTSEQAVKATEILNTKYGSWAKSVRGFLDRVTFIFEIIYPENRIVVDYGTMEDLVLLAVVDNNSGSEYLVDDWWWPGPTPKLFDHRNLPLHQIKDRLGISEGEGFVVKFSMGGNTADGAVATPAGRFERLKIKFDGFALPKTHCCNVI
jgi:RNA ligase